MKRLESFAGLSVAVLMGILGTPVAAAAGGASIKLTAPSSVPANTIFTVTASGHSPSTGKQFVTVFLTERSTCATTVAGARRRGDFPVPFHGTQGFVRVTNGAYRITSEDLSEMAPLHERWCGYLYRGTNATDKPEAHATKTLTIT